MNVKRKFVVTVNRKTYLVEVEETTPQVSENTQSTEKEEVISAPFPGKVLIVKVKEGDRINQGQCLITIEAMKMETEINAPLKGTVEKILVKEGETVETDSKLLVIK